MTTEEKARAYAENIFGNPITPRGIEETRVARKAYLAGAADALASQWKDPKVELPEDEETVLTLSSYGPVLAYYSKQDEMWFAYGNYGDITPTHWLPIPPLEGGSDTFDETDK